MPSFLPNDNRQNKPSPKELGGEQQVAIPEVIKSEVNFLVLPFFALWDKDVRRKTKTEYKTTIRKGEQRLNLSWVVVSNPEFGYPGPFDRTVYKAIEQIINGLPTPIQNPIPLGSLYNLCKRMGISKFGGSQYRKIKEALRRIMATSIISEGTFYHKEEEEWIEDDFHLINRIIFKGRRLPDGKTADTNYIFLNSWYIDNINAHYVKPVDWKYYISLETPVAQRLYELLSVKFYGLLSKKGRFISYRYSTLCSLLPIARQKYLSKAEETLGPAHKKLEETSFLEHCTWAKLPQKGREKDWLIKYYPGKRAREEIERFKLGEQLEFKLLPPEEKKTVEDSNELSVEESSIAEQLMQRGIAKGSARRLVKAYPVEQTQKQIEVFDWLRKGKNSLIGKNPAGFLRKSIEEDYQPPEEYLSHRDREAREQKEEDRSERWLNHREERIEQDIADWDKTPREVRVKGRLDFWTAGEKLSRRLPKPEQVEAKKQELIDSLPKTDEEKREYMARNYPEEPPGNFE